MKFSIAALSSVVLASVGTDATPSLRRVLSPAAPINCDTCTDCVVDNQGYAFRLQSYVNVTGEMGDPGTYTYTYAYQKCPGAVKNDLSHWNVWIASACNEVTDVSCTGNLGGFVPASSDGACFDINTPYSGQVGKCDTPEEGDTEGTITFTVTNVVDPDGGDAYPQSKPGNFCSTGLSNTLVGPTCGPGGVVNVCGDGTIVPEETCEKSDTDAMVYMNIVAPSTLGLNIVENCRPDTCTYCGDGIVNGPETCDGSPPTDAGGIVMTDADGNPIACNSDCGYCGDGFTNVGEECDGGDDCNADCTLSSSTPVCECTEAPVLITQIDDREVECGSGGSLDFAGYAQFQVCGESKSGEPVQTTKLPEASAVCPAGSKTMQWSVADCHGNTATATQTITLKDSTPPELPQFGTTDMLECGVDELQRPLVSATDKCDTKLADPILTTDTSNFNGKIGTMVDTWNAEDGCGNTATTTKTYEFVDTQPPTISGAPADQQLYCTSKLPDASSVKATDICVGDVTVSEQEMTNTLGAECDNVGSVERKWTAIDGHGNTATATQMTEFIDDIAPIITGVPSIDQSYQCGAVNLPTFESVVATDACGNNGLTLTSTETSDLHVIPGEERTVTWTAADCSGNEATASYTYQILDRCDFVVNESFSGVSMNVTVAIESVESTVGSGTFDVLKMTVTVTDSTYIGDIRGIFFHVTDAAMISDIKVDGKSTNYVPGNNDVDKVANDVLMKGGGKNAHKYDVGVEVGTRGKSKDDYQSVTITVEGINASDFDESSEVGIRLTSVGMTDGSREQSSKIFLDTPTCCRAGASESV